MSSHMSGKQSDTKMYVYELPYTERKKLCSILDMGNQWEILGKLMLCIIITHIQNIPMIKQLCY